MTKTPLLKVEGIMTFEEFKKYFDEITQYFSDLGTRISCENSLGDTSENVHCEGLVCRILNIIYDWKLKKADPGFHGIDLSDKENGICVQVTSEAGAKKIKKTIKSFIDNEMYHDYTRLIIFRLKERTNHRLNLEEGQTGVFNCRNDIIDFTDLLNSIQKLYANETSCEKFLKVYDAVIGNPFINFPDLELDNSMIASSIQRDDLVKSINDLIVSKTNYIRGKHGMGKTTYLLQLARKEQLKGKNTRFKYYLWVPYKVSLKSSIRKSLENTGLGTKDINNNRCLLLIDNAPKDIIQELGAKGIDGMDLYRFYCIVSTCDLNEDMPERCLLEENKKLAERIFTRNLGTLIVDLKAKIDDLVHFSGGHPLVAQKLSIQARNYLKNGKSLNDYIDDLKKEGFSMKIGDEESIINNLAGRFSEDYANLTSKEQSILKCFSILETSNAGIDPLKIKWASNTKPFIMLQNLGFLDRATDGSFSMHDLMCIVVRQLCGEIKYEDVQDLVKALSEYIDRRNLGGADMLSVSNEVYHAYSIFVFFSGNDYMNRQILFPEEMHSEYAWMATNIFSAFDDYFDPRAYNGSLFAVRLCEAAYDKSELSDYQLAASYNCLAYLPSMFKTGMKAEDILLLAAVNLEYLQKARSVYSRMEARGEKHPAFEARLSSNLGGFWQRLYRLNPTEKASSAYKKALEIRETEYTNTPDDDPSKDAKLIDYARSIYTLATDYFYAKRYDDSISFHEKSIAMYKKASSDTSYRLFVGYSRLAGTCHEKAKETMLLEDLVTAYRNYQKAYAYLKSQPKTVQDGADDFWEKFLEISCEIRRCSLSLIRIDPTCEVLIEEFAAATEKSKDELENKYEFFSSGIEYH